MKTIIILIALAGLLFTCVKWAFLPSIPYRRLPRHRVRYLRLRVRLRLHPVPGTPPRPNYGFGGADSPRSAAATGPGRR